MTEQIMMPGCEQRNAPEPSPEEQAETDRLHAAWVAEKKRRRDEVEREREQLRWRLDAERSARRRAMTPLQRAEDDRREAAEEAQREAELAEDERLEAEWKALTPAERSEVRRREREEEGNV